MLREALGRPGAGAAKVRVLFVSVDPQRDTAAVLKAYMRYFGSEFVGLRGDDAALNALTRRYRVAYHREKPDPHGYYAVDHSSAIFVFDQKGQARLLAEESAGPTAIASGSAAAAQFGLAHRLPNAPVRRLRRISSPWVR